MLQACWRLLIAVGQEARHETIHFSVPFSHMKQRRKAVKEREKNLSAQGSSKIQIHTFWGKRAEEKAVFSWRRGRKHF